MLQQYISGVISWMSSIFGLVGIGSKVIKDPPVK